MNVIHKPVLVKRVVELIKKHRCYRILDATFGGGGHTKAILDDIKESIVWSADRDPEAINRAYNLSKIYNDRITLSKVSFTELDKFISEKDGIDCILFDLGTSAYQIANAHRGFSFRLEGPLDMRMDPDLQKTTAADLVNWCSPAELEEIIRTYGEDPLSATISQVIVAERKQRPIYTTLHLANLIEKIYRPKYRRKSTYYRHPATQTFQALRIVVNREMDELVSGLNFAWKVLPLGGLLVVLSFHSLEDKIVKRFMNERAEDCNLVLPSPSEVEENLSSRTVRLRWCLRT